MFSYAFLKIYKYHIPGSNIVHLDEEKALLHCYKSKIFFFFFFFFFVTGQDNIYERGRVSCIVRWLSNDPV